MAGKNRNARSAPSRPQFDLAFRPRRYRWPRTLRNTDAIPAAEIIVARIRLATPHRDVVTLRARRGADGRIRYRMLHEAADSRALRRIRIRPTVSAAPLALAELAQLIDGAYYDGACADPHDQECYGRVVWGTLRLHFEHGIGGADEYLDFANVESEYYPELAAYYRERIAEWCLEHCEEADDCRAIVRMRARRG